MPTGQPNNAPADANDGETAASVLADEQLDDTPGGGGGLGGAAADPLGGSARGLGGSSPNAPQPDAPIAPDAAREAQLRSLEDTAEPHPSSM